MRYVFYAIIFYLLFYFIRIALRYFLKIFYSKQNKNIENAPKKRYDFNNIQDAEFKEVNNDK